MALSGEEEMYQDGYNEAVALWRPQVERLRGALIAAGNNAGAVLGDQVTTDFLMHVPEEIRLKVSRLTAENERLRTAVRSTASQGTLNMLAIRKAVSFELAELIWDEHMACQQLTPEKE